MWLLGRILPMIVGDLVPDDYDQWINYCVMMDIVHVDILLAPTICEDDAP